MIELCTCSKVLRTRAQLRLRLQCWLLGLRIHRHGPAGRLRLDPARRHLRYATVLGCHTLTSLRIAIAAEVSNSSFYLHGAANDVNCNALTGVYNSTNGSCVAADNGWHAVVIGMNAPLVAHRAFVGLECNNTGQFCANATNGIFYCNYVTYAMFDQCFEFDNSSAYVSNTTATRAPTPTPTPTPTQTRTPAPTTGANPTTATGSTVTTGSLTTTSAATQVSVSALLGLIVAMLALAH